MFVKKNPSRFTMKLSVLLLCLFGFTTTVLGQIGLDTGMQDIKIPVEEKSKIKMNGLLDLEGKQGVKEIDLYNPLTDPKPIDMSENSNLIDAGEALAQKWKDKAIKDAYTKPQYLGDFNVKGSFVSIECRDHEYVDGDRVRVFVNDKVVAQNVLLTSVFRGINIDLEKGFNKIDFLALNQGDSGPNTAEFRVFDSQGILVTRKEWNLTTGVKATIIFVNE